MNVERVAPDRAPGVGDRAPASLSEPAPRSVGPLVPAPFSDLGRRIAIGSLLVVGVYLLVRLRTLVSLVLVAALLAYVLQPAVDGLTYVAYWFTRRPLPRWAAILTAFLWLGSLFVLSGWFLLPPLAEQASALAKQLPEYYAQIEAIVEDLRRMSRTQLPPEWQQQIERYVGQAGGLALGFARNSVAILVGLFASILAIVLVPVLTYFMLLSAPGLRPKILAWFPPRLRPEVDFLVGEVNTVMYKFLRGRLTVCAIVALLVGAGTWWIGVPYPLLLGIAAGLLDLIPFIGPVLAAIPALFFAFLTEPSQVLWVIGLYAAVQQIEQVVLSPKIEGGELELNPAVVLVAAAAAGSLFGFLGVLLAIPITALSRIFLLYVRAKLRGEPIRPLGETAADEGA